MFWRKWIRKPKIDWEGVEREAVYGIPAPLHQRLWYRLLRLLGLK